MKSIFSIYVLLFAFAGQAGAQSILFPQDYIFEQTKRHLLFGAFDTLRNQHTGIFPNADSVADHYDETYFHKQGRKWLPRKLFQDHLIDIKKTDTIAGEITDLRIIVDPLFNFEGGEAKTSSGSSLKTYVNSRGILARILFNKNLRLESAFIENQAVFMPYLGADVKATKDVLGQGRWKNFKSNGYDYAMASGMLWWKPSKFFEIYLGHGKQKVGSGYRSLLLSDQAFNYPYIRYDINLGKSSFKYSCTYAVLMNLTPTAGALPLVTPFGTEPLLQKKPFSWQYVSWIPHKRINLGVFQGAMWQPSDARNTLSIDGNFFNPVMFVNPFVYGVNKQPKFLLGLDVNVRVTEDLHLYAQGASDGKKASLNNQIGAGLLGGFKYYNAFGLKNLFIQGEAILYRNNMYAVNSSQSQAAYTHYNRMLTFPAYSSDGNEVGGIIAYRLKRFMINSKAGILMHYNDIHKANYLSWADNRIGFIINSRTNMNISLGLLARNNNTAKHKNPFAKGSAEQLIYFSFRTSIYNIYTDI